MDAMTLFVLVLNQLANAAPLDRDFTDEEAMYQARNTMKYARALLACGTLPTGMGNRSPR